MKYFPAVIVIFSIITTQNLFAQEKPNRIIAAYSVNFYATTTFAVSCAQFEKTFNRIIDTVMISSADSIHQLDLLLEKVKFKHSKRVIDTRASIIFTTFSGTRYTFCMDLWNIAMNGRTISPSPELNKFLRSLVPQKNHPNGFHN
jgi:hypothetical protein